MLMWSRNDAASILDDAVIFGILIYHARVVLIQVWKPGKDPADDVSYEVNIINPGHSHISSDKVIQK